MTYEEWQAMEWDSSKEDFDSWFNRWWAEGKNHVDRIPHRHNDLDFPPKWVRGYVSKERGSGFTMQELTDMAKKTLDRTRVVPHDEQRDLGYDDQRDLFNDGPGNYGWSSDDEDPQPINY